MKPIFYSAIIAFLVATGCKMSNKEGVNQQDAWLPKDTSWKQLTLREKIGQTMLMKTDPKMEMELGNGSYKTLLEKYPVGGFFVANWVVNQYAQPDSAISYIKSLVRTYAENTKIPLVFQEDYESGVGHSVKGLAKMPCLMAVGATGDTSLAYDYGKSIAMESRSLGMNWLLHPVADLNMNSLTSLVTSRSVSDNAEFAINMLKQQIKAMHRQGVAATIKHFPGDGVDYLDQHMVTTNNSLTMDEWWKKHGYVFQELINSGADAVMTGHITLSHYQKEKIDGFLPPATLSKELTTDLLKGTMGFKGVVISDALEMGGFQQYYPTRISSQIACFEAGTDMLLWPDYAYMDTLEAKIKRNEIPMSRLDDAVARVWALKEKLGILKKDYKIFHDLNDSAKTFVTMTAERIAEKSITLVSNRKEIVPMKVEKGKRIYFGIVTPKANRESEVKNFRTTIEAFEKLGYIVDTVLTNDVLNPSLDMVSKYDRMIYAFIRAPFNPFSSKILNDDEAFTVWKISSLPPNKVITISYGDAYIHHRYFRRVGASINVYNSNPFSQIAVVKALTGQIPFLGKSPVILHDVYEDKY